METTSLTRLVSSLGRRWLGIELSEEFVTLAEERIADARRERSEMDDAVEAATVGEQKAETRTADQVAKHGEQVATTTNEEPKEV